MELHRLGVKFFLKEPASVQVRDFVPVFQTWIQQQALDDHLLIDVHDYSHVHQGPGILLVAHQGNFSIDQDEGRRGLLYYRKRPLNGSLRSTLQAVFTTALQACRRLEAEAALGEIRFRTDEFLILANDRLRAPNAEKTYAKLAPELSAFLGRWLGDGSFQLNHRRDPEERFAVRVTVAGAGHTDELLNRLS